MSKLSILLLSFSAVSACSASHAQKPKDPIKEAISLSKGAEECLIDVRDKGLKYERSSNCVGLKGLFNAYARAGGMMPDEPTQSVLIAEQARTTAWNALAISASSDPTISIW
jgi:hypothetical protein